LDDAMILLDTTIGLDSWRPRTSWTTPQEGLHHQYHMQEANQVLQGEDVSEYREVSLMTQKTPVLSNFEKCQPMSVFMRETLEKVYNDIIAIETRTLQN
jgi:hypothetical protein